MELLDLPQLADRAGLPLSLARYYRDRFILFVPSVRVGRTVLHPLEATDVLRLISEQAQQGANLAAIEIALEQAYPVTVITSQEVSREGEFAGATGVVNTLAEALDDRGGRLETDVASIREQLDALSSVVRSQLNVAETKGDWESILDEAASKLVQIKHMVEEVQSHQATLASQEQLEWIGDVVAAAVLRPAESGLKSAIERRLDEIQDDLRGPKPNADVAELRIAIERLTEHVHSRDAGYQRVLQSLVGAMRSEFSLLQAGINDLRRSAQDDYPALPLLLSSHRTEINGLDPSAMVHPGIESSSDHQKSRPPRRLGQPTRAPDTTAHDHGSVPGAG